MTPNVYELFSIFEYATEQGMFETPSDFSDMIHSNDAEFHTAVAMRLPRWVTDEKVVDMAVKLLPIVGTIWVKGGSRGVTIITRISSERAQEWADDEETTGESVVASTAEGNAFAIKHFPVGPIDPDAIESVVGAGDSFAGALLAGLINNLEHTSPHDLAELVRVGQM
jgi:pseudouridylate synthase / pseudouridine kinase